MNHLSLSLYHLYDNEKLEIWQMIDDSMVIMMTNFTVTYYDNDKQLREVLFTIDLKLQYTTYYNVKHNT